MGLNSVDWRQRAEEMRRIAQQTRDRYAKEKMLGIAHDYELLAGQSEYLEHLESEHAARRFEPVRAASSRFARGSLDRATASLRKSTRGHKPQAR
jgi:hypothetical protein